MRRGRPAAIGALVALALCMLALPGELAAQAGPRRLFPEALPRPSLSPPPQAGEGATTPQAEPAIRARDLAAPSPWQVTALADDDPLRQEPWGSLSPAVVRRLLESVPSPTPLTLASRLAPRVLAASPPAGVADADSFRARVERLVELGEAGMAASLLAAVPPIAAGDIRNLAFETRLLAGDSTACDGLQALGNSSAYTAAARITCALVRGELPRANILFNVLRERQVGYLPELEPFATAAIGGDAARLAATEGMFAHLALAVLGAHALSGAEAVARGAQPLVAYQLASNPNVPAAVRVAAAERAIAGGLPAADALRAALPEAGNDPRAVRLRALAAEQPPAVRAQRLVEAWRLELPPNEKLVWALALAGDARALEPSLETVAAAEAAVPILALTGEVERLRNWELLLGFPGTAGEQTARLRAGLEPFFLAAGMTQGGAVAGEPPTPRQRLVLAALGRLQGAQDPILAALGEDAAETGGPDAEAAGGAAPDPAVLRALGAAQQATAPAAVAVLALRLLEASEPEALPGDMALDAALRALVQAGLEKAAVEVGVAAMIADATSP